MQINPLYNTFSPSMNGKIWMNSTLSFSDKAFVERFLDYKKDGKCFRNIINSKPYDINVSKNNRGFIAIKSNYKKYLYDGKNLGIANVEVWHTALDENVDMESNYQRLINGFKNYNFCKRLSNGYNTKLGQARAFVTSWIKFKLLNKQEELL